MSAVAFALLGDVSSASALLSVAPALINAKHSRDFEREADAFAKRWLTANQIPARRFDDILCGMQSRSGGDADSPFTRYLSTHPTTDDRVRCDALDPLRSDQDGA